MPRLKRSVLNRQGRTMVYDVLTFMKKHADASGEAYRLFDIYQKTAEATNTSLMTVRRIVKEAGESEISFKTPINKKARNHPVTDLESFELGIVRRYIHNFHKTNRELPTIEKLRKKLRNVINFKGSEKSLRCIIKRMGFKWKRVKSNKGALIEKSNIRLERIQFLRQLAKYREEGSPIIYTGEFYIDLPESCPSVSLKRSIEGNKKSTSKNHRLIIIYAANETGIVPNSLFMFKVDNKSGDYHKDISNENYENWLRTQLMTNITPKSVVIVGNESYHNKLHDPAPGPNVKKSDMFAWLQKRGINYDNEMLKPQLYYLIKTHKNQFKKFYIDKILTENENKVLRLPVHHSDLNPAETAWVSIKKFLASEDTIWNMNNVKHLIKKRVHLMDGSYWKKLCADVENIEEEYRVNEQVIDLMTEELEFLADVEDSDSDSSSSSEDRDDEEDDDDGDSEDDEEIDNKDSDHANPNLLEYVKVEPISEN